MPKSLTARHEAARVHLRAGRLTEAAASVDAALRLWREPLLGGLRSGPIVDGFVTRMTDAWLECQEMQAETRKSAKQ